MLPAVRPAILLVDDDLTLLSVLSRRLAREGMEVRTAPSGFAALEALEHAWPALLVVDLMMPRMDGFELCRRVKRIADLPIIVLSAVDASNQRFARWKSTRRTTSPSPSTPMSWSRACNRVLRRAPAGAGQLILDGGELEIDLTGRRVVTAAGTHALTPTEVRLLQVLVASLDHTVPTETLLDRVWSEADGADPSYVWVSMRRLRRKLELDPDNPRYLITERGVGYRLASTPPAGEGGARAAPADRRSR